jgi:aminoglycoside phosphotransferase (APT) family kinase protein
MVVELRALPQSSFSDIRATPQRRKCIMCAGKIGSHRGFEQILHQLTRDQRVVVTIHEQPSGLQGASGSQIRYFDVTSTDRRGVLYHDTLVTKEALLLERRILRLLTDQGCAVPPVYLPDVTTDARMPVYMPYLAARPPGEIGYLDSPLTHAIAGGLAGIHAANRQQPPPWLPHASEDYRGRLWLHAWRDQWERNLADPAFAAEFGRYTSQLEAAMEHLLLTLNVLTAERTSLTLLNVDLIPEHIRLWRNSPCFIDWEQAAYGSLYLDLPNHFAVETVLIYRDALAARGYAIPVPEFLERYHAVGHYMGLRYLGYALRVWAQGGTQREQGRWFLYYTFKLALHGR